MFSLTNSLIKIIGEKAMKRAETLKTNIKKIAPNKLCAIDKESNEDVASDTNNDNGNGTYPNDDDTKPWSHVHHRPCYFNMVLDWPV